MGEANPRVGWNEDGTIDEVFHDGHFHMEQLDDGLYWFGVYGPDGGRFSWVLWATGDGRIEARVQDCEPDVSPPDNADDRWEAPPVILRPFWLAFLYRCLDRVDRAVRGKEACE